MMASLVIIRLLTDDASSSAVRTTCAARARARTQVACRRLSASAIGRKLACAAGHAARAARTHSEQGAPR